MELVHHYVRLLHRYRGRLLTTRGAEETGSGRISAERTRDLSPQQSSIASRRVSCNDHLICVLLSRTQDRASDILRVALNRKFGGNHSCVNVENADPDVIGAVAADIASDFQAMVREEVIRWLQPLNESQRCMVQLILDGYDVRQIADRFGESEAWVESAYHQISKAFT
jgi:hypothetical protein